MKHTIYDPITRTMVNVKPLMNKCGNYTKTPNPIQKVNGKAEWTSQEGDHYSVTGVDRSGKRFKRTYENFIYADAINVWRGNLWLVRGTRRYLIKSKYN